MPRRWIVSRFPVIVLGSLAICALPAVAVPPPNDNCSTPDAISGNGTFNFDLTQATNSGEGQEHCATPGQIAFEHDVWYCWTANCTGLIEISTCGQTNVDTKISFYIGGCACPTPPPSNPPLCCIDDTGGTCGVQTFLTCEVVCGQQFLIRLGVKPGTLPGTGTFTINCNGTPCAQCDDCCGARPNFLPAAFNGAIAAVTQESGVNTRVLDLIHIGAPQPPVGSMINWNAPFYAPTAVQNWTHLNLGSVFGVAYDNLGNIYVTHTSVYGVIIGGSPGDAIGTIAGGAAGAIYKINTNTGVPSVFAVLPNAQITACTGTECWPGLGNICYSCQYDNFYVSNHEDGRIYRLNSAGTVLSTWKHATGALQGGGGLDPFDTNGFSPLGPSSNGRGQRVWGVRTNQGRLYYGVWREDSGRPDPVRANEVWSVALFPSGEFIPGSEQLEITVPGFPGNNWSNPVSDISFKPNTCCMLLAERTMQDDTTSGAHQSRHLEYCKQNGVWVPSSNTFSIGSFGAGAPHSSAGGCDYDFHTGAGVNVNVWGTGDAMKFNEPPAADPFIYGIGGMTFAGTNPYANGLMVDSNQLTGQVDKFMQGDVEITCPAAGPPQGCQPQPGGAGCGGICPPSAPICRPKCIFIGFDGVPHVTECECATSTNSCHIDMSTGVPECVGSCPPGQVCIQRIFTTPDGTLYCCECVDDPPACVPASDGLSCVPFNCDSPVPETCRPRCLRIDPAGTTTIVKCDCRRQDECHVEFIPGTPPHCAGTCPPGFTCVQTTFTHPDGVVDFCCDCIEIICHCPGDINGDGVLNGLDIAGFVRCLLGAPLPTDNCACADIDGNGVSNTIDLNLFVQLILTKHDCEETPCCPREDLSLNLATGVNNDGSFIPVGNDDPDWIVFLDAGGGSVPRPATVVTPHPSWLTIPGTQWISANYFGPNGEYGYEFCFCLDPRFSNPLLTLQIRADDASQVFLNGNFLGNGGGYNDPQPATLTTNNPAFFVPGRNCVRVLVQNLGGAPTGMNMAGTFTADDGKCCCPPQDLNKNVASGVYDNNGNLIPVGSDDDTWVVTVDPSGGNVPRPATVVNPHPLWLTIPGTQWVSANYFGPNGIYHYEYCFCLDPRFENPAIVLDLRADDYAEVWFNGVMVGATPNGWAFNTPQPTHVVVTNPDLFLPCENCIEIIVHNTGGPPTGFNIAGSITAENGLCCEDHQFSCCLPNGLCIDLAPGVTQCPGEGVLLNGPCQQERACCLPNGTCQMLDPRCCVEANGIVLPAGAICSPQAQACCYQSPTGQTLCVTVDPACCSAIFGGTPQGPGSTCQGDLNGNGVDDSCEESPFCVPNPATQQCPQTACPVAGEECFTRCVLVDSATGVFIRAVSCDCLTPADCHVELTPPPTTPICVGGNCPAGTQCTRTEVDNGDGTKTICCRCEPIPPPQCGPDPVAIGCLQSQCPGPGQCLPVCVRILNGFVIEVLQCQCRSTTTCHVEWNPDFSNPHCVGGCEVPGQTCFSVLTPNADGSQTLCCNCMIPPP